MPSSRPFDYIQQQNYFDIVYSEKAGYLRIFVDSPEEEAILLNTPEIMMNYLCGDVISDVVYSLDNPKKTISDLCLTEQEKAESRRRLTAIFNTMGIDEDRCLSLAEKYIINYQGDLWE